MPKIQPAQSGYLDMSQFCNILEIPQGQVTRAMGDVHPLGNPHYWLNPDNGRRMGKALADKFSSIQPANAAQNPTTVSQTLDCFGACWNYCSISLKP